MTRPIETIRAEIAELEDANAKAPGWGGAVGARLERLSGLYGEMAAAARGEAQLHGEPLPERWVNARIDENTGRLFYTSEADARANGAPGITRPVRVSGPEPAPAEAEGWRPIESAPRGSGRADGPLILLHGGSVYFESSGYDIPNTKTVCAHWSIGECDWIIGNDEAHREYVRLRNPQGWMPLPPSPAGREALRKEGGE